MIAEAKSSVLELESRGLWLYSYLHSFVVSPSVGVTSFETELISVCNQFFGPQPSENVIWEKELFEEGKRTASCY